MSNTYRYEFLISEGLEEEINGNYDEAIKKYSDAIISIPYKTCGYYYRSFCFINQLNYKSVYFHFFSQFALYKYYQHEQPLVF